MVLVQNKLNLVTKQNILQTVQIQPDYKTIFMLNSAEHEILNIHKYKNINQLSIFRLG